ncbi:MAG: hypothetical protein WCS38_11915, partial [Mesotoga sp.]|uniref:hypothetical protein n=1 Tax=Mesotoga sp. TaxID=2053577 RepID=UPI0035663231
VSLALTNPLPATTYHGFSKAQIPDQVRDDSPFRHSGMLLARISIHSEKRELRKKRDDDKNEKKEILCRVTMQFSGQALRDYRVW